MVEGKGDGDEEELDKASLGVVDNRARMIEMASNRKRVAMSTQFTGPNHERVTWKALKTKPHFPVVGNRYEQMDYFLIKTR